MAQVQNAAAASILASLPGADGASKPAAAEDPTQRFLTLLVTQMRNQDPLSPLDSAQMTSQLAQLNTVDGINQLNATMKSLMAGFAATQMLQAATLVGHAAMVPGSQISLAAGQALFGVELPQAADQLQVTISDAAGNAVHRVALGPQPAGIIALHWDGAADAGGTAPDGAYRITLGATSGGKDVAPVALTVNRVVGVSAGGTGVQLELDSGSTVSLGDVRQFN